MKKRVLQEYPPGKRKIKPFFCFVAKTKIRFSFRSYNISREKTFFGFLLLRFRYKFT